VVAALITLHPYHGLKEGFERDGHLYRHQYTQQSEVHLI
jgi:hypothetical protein